MRLIRRTGLDTPAIAKFYTSNSIYWLLCHKGLVKVREVILSPNPAS